jgi:signal transduction histidine kinase
LLALAPLGAARHRTGRGSVDRIISNVTRASDILRRLRDLSKKRSPQKEVLDVNAAILEVMALARSEAVKSGVMVRTRLASQLPPSEGDRIQLQQVMLNLIVNAIQAMSGEDDAGRELEISTQTVEARGVLVGVRDTGPGLSEETLPRPFDPFLRRSSTAWAWAVDLSLDRRSSRRALMRERQRAQGGPLSVHHSRRLPALTRRERRRSPSIRGRSQ